MPDPFEPRSALLLALAPFAVAFAHQFAPRGHGNWAAAGVGALLVFGALAIRAPFGRGLATLGLLLAAASSYELLSQSPAVTLITLSLVSLIIARVWSPVPGESSAAGAVRTSAWVYLAAAVVLFVVVQHGERSWWFALMAGQALLVVRGVAWMWRAPRDAGWWLVLSAFVLLGAGLASQSAVAIVPALVAVPGALLLGANPSAPALARALSWTLHHPARLVVATFTLLSALGSLLLALPGMAASSVALAPLDAAFTAVSAVCVTGLIVVDTPHAFAPAGQVVILALIQIGGLGIMTFYTVALRVLGKRLSLRHELTVAGAIAEREGRLFSALYQVLWVTAGCELVGAAVLSFEFHRLGDSAAMAVWRGLFTAVSAFCNAGFALQTDSLVPYQGSTAVLHTVALLIIAGGASPLALVSLPRMLRARRASLQVRLIWLTTGILVAVGGLGWLAFEWLHSLKDMSWSDRLNNAWFQGVTLRTAGFNSVDLQQTSDVTRSFMMLLMFIGGSPGGTAGGIKTTTAAVLILALHASLGGHTEVQVLHRRLRHSAIYKAIAVATMGMLSCLVALSAVQLTQAMPFDVGLFEVVSALGTVGLSLGGTAQLDGVGKVIIMLCMLMGRVGPLTLLLFLAGRSSVADWQLPSEDVDVG